MQILIGVAVLGGVFISPYQQIATRRNGTTRRYCKLRLVGQIISQVITGEINRIGSCIIKLKPIFEMIISIIHQCPGVACHPLVNDDIDWWKSRIIGGARSWIVEVLTTLYLAIRIGPI